MPIIRSFTLPASSKDLTFPDKKPFYLAFVASNHPETGVPWCPDVRAAMPVINAAFEKEDGPALGMVEVGQKPEWKEPSNVFRTKWNVHNVPCLARFERGEDGTVKEVGRLIEEHILEKEKLEKFLA